MRDARTADRVTELRTRIAETRAELRGLLGEAAQGPVKDYELQNEAGKVRLSALFGGKRDLIVVHNMGTGCAYCTLWADGYNGLYPHLADRAAFVVSSPDAPERQAAFAMERGWRFPMVSHAGTSFAADMGFADEDNRCLPGVSAFRNEDGSLVRVAASGSEPHDDFCALWHLFDLLSDGVAGWRPKFRYG